MTARCATACALFGVLAAGLAPAALAEPRLALVIGDNRGLGDEELLRFAEHDAERVRDALVDVGGFTPGEVMVLQDADATAVRQALTTLEGRLAAGGVERLFIYVSSHAGDGVLHLKGTELPMQEVVDFVKRAPVRVGLLVVDACRSGAVTRLKGLKPRGEPTHIEATQVEGRVLISASGADEYAQESDELGGSYFTHYFIAGLRGAADGSGDGRVTLDEVYGWAWARTIESTFASYGGVQRPAFSVDLRGQGQLVLSEPGAAKARLTLDVKAPGRWLVVASSSGQVVADVDKGEGPVSLAVKPGEYRVRLRVERGVLERTVTVPASGAAVVRGDDLERASLVEVARKGGPETRLVLSGGGGVASGLVPGLVAQPGVEVRLRRDGYLLGPLNQLSLTLEGRTGEGRDGSFHQLELELRLGTGHRFSWREVSLLTGVELGPVLVLQSQLPDGSGRTGLGLTLAAVLEARLRLGGPVEAYLLGTGGGSLIRTIISGVTLSPRLAGSLGVAIAF